MKNVHDEIYQLSGNGSWVEVGKMREGRSSHGVSEINYSEVEQYCSNDCDDGSGEVDCSSS